MSLQIMYRILIYMLVVNNLEAYFITKNSDEAKYEKASIIKTI